MNKIRDPTKNNRPPPRNKVLPRPHNHDYMKEPDNFIRNTKIYIKYLKPRSIK